MLLWAEVGRRPLKFFANSVNFDTDKLKKFICIGSSTPFFSHVKEEVRRAYLKLCHFQIELKVSLKMIIYSYLVA